MFAAACIAAAPGVLLRVIQHRQEVVIHRKPSDRVDSGAQLCEYSSWVVVMCVSLVESSSPTESRREKTTKTNNERKTAPPRMNMQTLLQNNTMRRQIHGPAYVNVGPAYIEPGSHGPRCQVMGQAGLAEALEKMVGRDRPGREFFENVMGWAGPWHIL